MTPGSVDDARRGRRIALQHRIMTAGASLLEGPNDLFRTVRTYLIRACDDGALRTKPGDIYRLLKLAASPFGDRDQKAILGGEKDLKRRGGLPCFVRHDGATFDFVITVTRRSGEPMVLFAYDFELRFPSGLEPRFVRFDLNEAGHENEQQGLRCHMHPGHDDLQVPAPLLHPIELLDLLIYEAVHPERPRAA